MKHLNLPHGWVCRLADALITRIACERAPDFIVGGDDPQGAYLLRWYITPWRRWLDEARAHPSRRNRARAWVSRLLPNLYLHQFLRDDDPRALHDHPSWAMSLLLRGGYLEHTIASGGIHQRRAWHAGQLRFLPTLHAHRIELPTALHLDAATGRIARGKDPCWTLFLFGPARRTWGFHCPQRGWVPWREFTAADRPGEIGKGCDA